MFLTRDQQAALETQRPTGADPRAAALVTYWALRYTAGRHTYIYHYTSEFCHLVLPAFNAEERVRMREGAVICRDAAAGQTGPLRNEGEDRVWQDLIDAIDATTGEGSSEPVDVGLGRNLALACVSAMRRTIGYDHDTSLITAEEQRSVAEALGVLAPQWSPNDRVLMLRDLFTEHEMMERSGWIEADGLSPAWVTLYNLVSDLGVDESYLRSQHAPEYLPNPVQPAAA